MLRTGNTYRKLWDDNTGVKVEQITVWRDSTWEADVDSSVLYGGWPSIPHSHKQSNKVSQGGGR